MKSQKDSCHKARRNIQEQLGDCGELWKLIEILVDRCKFLNFGQSDNFDPQEELTKALEDEI